MNKLYSSRTGNTYTISLAGDSDEERRAVLKQRICEEKILRMFRETLQIQMRKKKGEYYSIDMRALSPDDIAEAVLTTAAPFLAHPELVLTCNDTRYIV